MPCVRQSELNLTPFYPRIFDLNAALFKDIRSGFGNLLVDVCLDSIFGTWRPLRALEVFTKVKGSCDEQGFF